MKPILRYSLLSIALTAMLAGMVALLAGSASDRHLKTCKGLKVESKDSLLFVTAADVKQYLDESYGSYVGQRLDSVDLCRIEKILDERGPIFKSEAYTTPDGTLHVRITEREPRLKFITGEGKGFYADASGYLFPLQAKYDAPVRVIDGKLPLSIESTYKGLAPTPEGRKWIADVLALDDWMVRSRIWREAFVRISVTERGELELTPREGKEVFLFGYPEELQDKFAKIGRYYEYIRPSREEDYYKTVNLKYNGQIICRHKK